MEFGNIRDTAYGVVLLLGGISLIAGIIKKKKIIEALDLERLRATEYGRGISLLLGTALIFLALLAPQRLERERRVKTEGLSIYILVDISRSMLAEDVYPNRIEAAKTTLREVIGSLQGDRVGIIPFSSSAYIQMPLTDDYNIAGNYIDVIDTGLISGGGTDILQGLKLANSSFQEIGSQNKLVLIISDGGEEERKALEYAKSNDIRIYSMGVGTSKGSVLPNYDSGGRRGFITDAKGNTVVSRINESFLQKLAQNTGGRYYRIDNLSRKNTFAGDISSIGREKGEEQVLRIYKHYYQIPLLLGFLLVLLGVNIKGGIADEEED